MSELQDVLNSGDQRPAAAVFESYEQSPLLAYKSAEAFWIENCDLLIGNCGVIIQLATHSPSGMQGPPGVSLLFDARRRSEAEYLWELTDIGQAGRLISQLTVRPSAITGQQFAMDASGLLRHKRPITAAETTAVLEQINNLLAKPEIEAKQNTLRKTKLDHEKALSDFGVAQSLHVHERHITPHDYVSLLKDHEKKVDSIGYTALLPYHPQYES